MTTTTTTDKAVSTEDLEQCATANTTIITSADEMEEVLPLDALLGVLLENKVEILREQSRRKSSSLHSSPRETFRKWKVASKYGNGSVSNHHRSRCSSVVVDPCQSELMGECYCSKDIMNFSSAADIDIVMKVNDDHSIEASERRKRSKRRRRKRRTRRAFAQPLNASSTIITVPMADGEEEEEAFKVVLDPDELSQRARVTIAVTACLLLFMCLLLVGVTLRMAPIIDDMVRRENEEMMNSLTRDTSRRINISSGSSSTVLVMPV